MVKESTHNKWFVYEILKQFAGKVVEIAGSDKPVWHQQDAICEEAESVADQICQGEADA